MKEFTITFILVTLGVFAITALAERILIPILRSHKAGQKILDIGPRWHKSKEGTPIMGGIGFILAILAVIALFFIYVGVKGEAPDYIPLALTVAFAVANGAIGFVDDYCKLIKKQNEGLTRIQKLVLQFAITAGYLCVMGYTGNLPSEVVIPLINLPVRGALWYILAGILTVGVINGANFTDGLDGLASTVTYVIGIFFAIFAFYAKDIGLSVVSAALIGGTLGFLLYNIHPAKVFMGDTGSLFLGAIVMGALFQMQEPLLTFLVCAVYIIELLSTVLQILYFKLTHGKRLFKMAPIHHHFEKCGWSENKVVIVFALVQFAFCTLAFILTR
ncbi:MAG: phospho-N-acetylmuramoyl-pentapeptide-transferase [Ruminococcaceae bacterium]|nr:phospho-N-acetylmuramoyl-pentapeptide-transferase [Oscillospiraceae bacterium]